MGRKRNSGCLRTVVAAVGIISFLILLVLMLSGAAGDKIKRGVKESLNAAEPVPFKKVTITEEELTEKYYYHQLSKEERTIYKEITQGVRDHVEEIYVHASDAELVNTIFQYVLKDYPDIFWCDGTTKSTSYEGDEPYTILNPQYLYNQEEKVQKKAEIEAAAQECLSGISAEAADYDKLLYIYEYIVNTVDYDLNAPDNQNIYSVFVNKRSVCAGYSKAFQYLAERLGVFCTYVTGKTTEGQNHAWNLVKCNGDYYYVDSTWGDPIFQASEGESDVDPGYISYDYMCCNDEELLKTHVPDQDVALPACTKMDANYYVVNGMYYTAYDGENALKAMNDVIASGGNPVVLKFATNDLYLTAREDIFNNQIQRAAQNLAEWYGLKEVVYHYLDEPELCKITIYWQYE